MQTTSVAGFQKNISALLAQTIKYNEPLNVCTEDGNVIILSDEDYRGMVETVRQLSMRQDALNAWKKFQDNGLHLTSEEADAWLAELEKGVDMELPQCHV